MPFEKVAALHALKFNKSALDQVVHDLVVPDHTVGKKMYGKGKGGELVVIPPLGAQVGADDVNKKKYYKAATPKARLAAVAGFPVLQFGRAGDDLMASKKAEEEAIAAKAALVKAALVKAAPMQPRQVKALTSRTPKTRKPKVVEKIEVMNSEVEYGRNQGAWWTREELIMGTEVQDADSVNNSPKAKKQESRVSVEVSRVF